MENEDKAIEILKGKKFSTIGNFSYNDAFDAIIEMAKWKDAQRRTPSDDTTEGFVHIVIGEVACHETELERRIEQGKAFAESNKTVFDVAMAVAKFYDEQLQMRMDAYERERQALAEIEKLKEYIKKVCAESSADIQRLDTENKELRERNEALKRQLDESNKQIEIHAKREREFESELEEYNDERNFI